MSMRQKKRSNNPNNKECSPCKQALLDLKAAGCPQDLLDELIKFVEDDKHKLNNADNLFNEHQYPENNTDFYKGSRNVQYHNWLSSNAIALLSLMIQNMRCNNLIELSVNDIIAVTKFSSNKTVSNVLKELKETGCIAVKFKRSKTRGTVYMVNPSLATVGKVKNLSGMIYNFWLLSGDVKEDKGISRAAPHNKWISNQENKTYSRGYDKQDFSDKTNKPVYFNKLNEPCIEKGISGAGTPEINNSPDD